MLEFWSFVFFGPGCIIGPFMEYSDYINFIEFKGVYEKLPHGMTDGYTSWKPSFIRLLHAIFCAVVWVGVTGIFGLDPNYSGTKEFVSEGNLVWRFFFINITGTAQRFFYYFAWCFVDTACIASGITFNGIDKTGEAQWDRIICIYMWDFEFAAPSMPGKSRAWNH